MLGVSYFQQPPRAGGLTYPTQVGVAPSRPEMGVFQLHQGGVSPLGNSSAGGDEYVHGAGIPSEKALVRGAEGQRRMESPWCSHLPAATAASAAAAAGGGSMAHTPWPAAPNTEEQAKGTYHAFPSSRFSKARVIWSHVPRHGLKRSTGSMSAAFTYPPFASCFLFRTPFPIFCQPLEHGHGHVIDLTG